MALNRRERLLSLGIGSVVAIALVQVSYNYVAAMFSERQIRIEALEKEIKEKKDSIVAGDKATKKLTEWRKRSLPTDAVMARALYKNWLAGIVEGTGLAKADITLGADLPKPGIYTRTPVNVRGQGSMEQVIRLLFAFYRANHLHQIRQLTLTPIARPVEPTGEGALAGLPGGAMGPGPRGGMGDPGRWAQMRARMGGGGPGSRFGGGPGAAAGSSGIPGGGMPPAMGRDMATAAGSTGASGTTASGARGTSGFPGRPKKVGKDDGLRYDVTLSIEGLSLADADRTDRLSEGEAKRLAFDDADRYVKTITERSLFTPPKPDADPARDMFVTAVVKKEGQYQVWMNVRSSGKTLKLSQGDTFDVGDQEATITKIEPQTVEITIADKTRVVSLGKSLAEERPRGFGGRGRRFRGGGFEGGGDMKLPE